jgi:hypothetical protein
MKSTIFRISLAVLFCLGMLGTVNPTTLGQGDRGKRQKCQKECQDKYQDRLRECKDKRGRERRECRDNAAKELRECRKGCSSRLLKNSLTGLKS